MPEGTLAISTTSSDIGVPSAMRFKPLTHVGHEMICVGRYETVICSQTNRTLQQSRSVLSREIPDHLPL